MDGLKINTDPRVNEVFALYPEEVRDKMQFLRALVIETAKEMEDVDELEQTLKWGEPSFVTKNGSTLRMDWKKRSPDQYAMYFQCTSRLVETFRIVFEEQLRFEGKRAIILDLEEEVPVKEIKACIKASLNYHKVKDDMTLGI